MREISIEDRFHGTCNLVILHLRRAAKSNDLERGFAFARDAKMLGPDHEAFVRKCLRMDGLLQAGKEADEPVTDELIRELQRCVLRLNTADPA